MPASTAPKCPFCDNDKFRRSHVQARDLLRLLMLQFPVRCLTCRKRQYLVLMSAVRAKSNKARFYGDAREKAIWNDWRLTGRPSPEPADGQGGTPRLTPAPVFAQGGPTAQPHPASASYTPESGSSTE